MLSFTNNDFSSLAPANSHIPLEYESSANRAVICFYYLDQQADVFTSVCLWSFSSDRIFPIKFNQAATNFPRSDIIPLNEPEFFHQDS